MKRKKAKSLTDFTETEWKEFARREGDKWTFFIPHHEMQGMNDALAGFVLTVESTYPGPAQEIMYGKLVKI